MGAYTRTCKWCGKHYELNQVHGGWDIYNYCSLRCQSAAKRERQRENQQAKEEAEKFEKDHPLLSSIYSIKISACSLLHHKHFYFLVKRNIHFMSFQFN